MSVVSVLQSHNHLGTDYLQDIGKSKKCDPTEKSRIVIIWQNYKRLLKLMGGILMYCDEYKHHGAIICLLSHVGFFFSLIGSISGA